MTVDVCNELSLEYAVFLMKKMSLSQIIIIYDG
jgi:hypothetical protein